MGSIQLANPMLRVNEEKAPCHVPSLLSLDRTLAAECEGVTLGARQLTAHQILAVARGSAKVEFTDSECILERIAECHSRMMDNVRDGVPVYGCNTGYGAQAAKRMAEGSGFLRDWSARSISEAISAIDVSVGPAFDRDIVRGGMLIRINMLMAGVSGVKIADLDLIRELLNHNLTPLVNQFGGLGASGDLAHNARVVSVLRQLRGAKVIDASGRVLDAPEAMAVCKIPPLQLDPKAGLGLCNGDNFSTSIALLLTIDTLRVLLALVAVSAMTIEVLGGTDRVFHPMLSALRPHPGQSDIAYMLRCLLSGSSLAQQEMTGPKSRPQGVSVQDGYSLRGLAQYLGVSAERVLDSINIVERNANSVSDNPLWVPPEYANEGETPWQWVSGANFLAMHVAEVMDGIRKTLSHIVKLCDRHLARMVNPNLNNGLSPNLSEPLAITGCTFKGVQIQSGMFDVYSQILSQPVTTMFGVHEEGNQDVTSHALTSGILGLENLRLARYSVAQNLMAVAQAVDLRGGPHLLSPRTRPIYDFIRSRVEYANHERPMHFDIECLYATLVNDEFGHLLRSESFSGLGHS